MNGDGAHLGVGAERALDTILGGQPSPEESGEDTMTPQQMREWIMSAPQEPQSYDDAARSCARLVLRAFEEHPFLKDQPAEVEYDWDADPDRGSEGMKPEFVIKLGLYETMKRLGYPLSDLDLTGFQWGWAVNAARYSEHLPAWPNPAIIEIRTEDEP